ncbi:MAG TPA: GGDEF domain-containing protein, partial [Ilumatobacteraceae bacterium]|nr:GGDEF domain-containing protein [Ilumatobacteraceae bacterium]
EAIASWRATADTTVIEQIRNALALGAELNLGSELATLQDVEIEVLWSLARYDEARAALERNHRDTMARLHDERAARWEHVRLGVEHRRVEALSSSDPLTGLPNRRHLENLLPEALDGKSLVCIALIDLDGFKQVNDVYGYLIGDAVLQDVAGLLERVCRRNDEVVRLGGDEFVMVLRDTSPGDARVVLERVRQLIAARTYQGLPSSVRLTASVGVAVGSSPLDCTRVVADAAEALQRAKRSGRDRICFR